ncbi:hypothetical protein GGR57DRAFT_398634 [Xylariaceae sp. FL1272]|nr:hypothetical protein GGR57DRAFT_398634 [Xylariaceae sp. FL1272]
MALTLGVFTIVDIVLAVFVTVPVVGRLTHNHVRGQGQHLDDYFAAAALFFYLLLSIFSYFELKAVILSAANDEHDSYFYIAAQWLDAGQSISVITTWFCKAPLLLFYIRLFGVKDIVRLVCYITLVVTALVYVITSTYAAMECNPYSPYNYSLGREGYLARCVPLYARVSFIPTCTFSLIQDIINFVLPIPLIWRLNLSRSKKVGLCFVFVWGSLAIVASILSLYTYVRNGLATGAQAYNLEQLLTLIDCAISLVVSCVPSLHSIWIVHVANNELFLKFFSMIPSIPFLHSGSRSPLQRSPSYIQERSNRQQRKSSTRTKANPIDRRVSTYIELDEDIP